MRSQWLAQDTLRRQELCKEFIEAAKCDADALQHEQPGVPAWIELYAKIGRMRLRSSPRVAALAEQVGQKIIDTDLEPVINLKTAKALGLELAASLMARADEVIE